MQLCARRAGGRRREAGGKGREREREERKRGKKVGRGDAREMEKFRA